jgi:hypothetical protein
MATLSDLFSYVDKQKSELVVWRRLTTLLQNEFLATDTTGADQKLLLDDGRTVDEEVIEEVIQVIYRSHIAPAEQKVRDLLESELDSALAELRSAKKEERHGEKEESTAKLKKAKK